MDREALERLSKEELIAVVLALAAQVAALEKRGAELEGKLGQPPKTPDNSSVPPSQGKKPNCAEERAAERRAGRPGSFRKLAEHPDRIVETLAPACPHCAHPL